MRLSLATSSAKHAYWVVIVGLCLFWLSNVQAETARHVPVASSGKTSIVATSGNVHIEVVLITRTVDIKASDRDNIEMPATSCTFSRIPCSVVDKLSIRVSGREIIIPTSVFLDLADINTAELIITKATYSLRLNGGDASESYRAVIDFDGKHVKAKRLYSGEGGALLQETKYHLVSM